MPILPEEVTINRSVFAVSPLMVTTFVAMMGSDAWGTGHILISTGIGVVATSGMYRYLFVSRPRRGLYALGPRVAATALISSVASAGCAALIGRLLH